MEATSLQKRAGYLVIGAIGLFLAAGYLGMAVQLPFGELERPGAGIFPVAVGVMLALVSLATVWEGWRTGGGARVEFPAGGDRKRLLALVALLFFYFLALPWLGQILASSIFVMLLMRVLSHIGWPRIVGYSLAISIALYLVFVHLLQVPMPRGLLV